MICKHILLITFVNKPELIFIYLFIYLLLTLRWFQVFLYNTNNSVYDLFAQS